jgi:hypothetical protein
MLNWLLEQLFRRGFDSRRGSLYLKDMENLARAGAASWLLSQERARLDYLAAKEAYCNSGTWSSFQRMLERLLKLSSTNALVHSLLNEQMLERRITETAEPAARRSA